MSAAGLQALPIPQAPLVTTSGHITNPWYRLILALIQRTGGTQGKVTPDELEPFVVLSGLMTGEVGTGVTHGLLLGDVGREGELAGGGLPLFPDAPITPARRDVVPQDAAAGPHFPVFPQDPSPAFVRFMVPQDTPNAPPDVEGQTPGASPWTYTPGVSGWVLVSGGTVSAIAWSRDGVTFLATGMITGFFPVEVTDSVRITYTVAPTVTLIRRPI